MLDISIIVLKCRICSSDDLELVIDLGSLALTGVFLEDGKQAKKAPLVLKRCKNCGLVQLGHNYVESELYGNTYGYESHLNQSMVDHLQQKARTLEHKYLKSIPAAVVVDIASNDGTLLSGYKRDNLIKIGIDPLIDVVSDRYPLNALKIRNFFSSQEYWKVQNKSANLVTSLSVIYDLTDPVGFAKQIYEILEEDGIWHFEQSYLPLMIETLSYDTICHEHLLYLSMHDIKKILELTGFKIIEASMNGVNGGSIAISAIKTNKLLLEDPFVNYLISSEIKNGILDGSKIANFAKVVMEHSQDFRLLIIKYKELGYDVIGLGASTKGNVLIQIAGLDSNQISAIGDVNPRKFGKQTPGSAIPIFSEKNLLENASELTIAVVFPWHFRAGIVNNLEKFIMTGRKLLIPLPRIEVVSA